MSNVKRILAAVAIASVASFAQAATLTINPVVTGAFNAAFEPIAIPVNNSGAAVYQVDFYLGLSGLDTHPGATGLGSTGFDINLAGSLTKTAGTDWTGNNPSVDVNGVAPGGNNPLFLINTDGGVPGDLKFITISMAGGAFNSAVDPRYWVGQSGAPAAINTILANNSDGVHPPFKIGQAFISFDGTGQAQLSITGQGLGVKIAGNSTQITGFDTNFGVVNFGEIPEPATLSLAAIAGLGLVRRRRA